MVFEPAEGGLPPGDYRTGTDTARVLLARRELNEAVNALQRVIELKPDHIEAHYALARTFQQLGKNDLAAREFKIVSELHARSAQRSSGIAGSSPQ